MEASLLSSTIVTYNEDVRKAARQEPFKKPPKIGLPALKPKTVPKLVGNAYDALYPVKSVMIGSFGDGFRIKGKIYNVCWNCTGSNLFLASRENVAVLNPYQQVADRIIQCPAVAVLPHPTNSQVIAVVAYDRTAVRLFDLRVGQNPVAGNRPKGQTTPETSKDKNSLECSDVKTTTSSLIGGAWHPDGRTIAVNDKSDMIQVIDLNAGFEKQIQSEGSVGKPGVRSQPHDVEVGMICFSSNGEKLFVTRQSGKIDVYPANPLTLNVEEKIEMQAHYGYACCAASSADGKLLATGGVDENVNLIDIASLSHVGSISDVESTVNRMAFSSSNLWLSWGTRQSSAGVSKSSRMPGSRGNGLETGLQDADCSFTIASVDPYGIVKSFPQCSSVASLSWHPHRDILAVASEYGTRGFTSGDGTSAVGYDGHWCGVKGSRSSKQDIVSLVTLE